MKEQIDGNFSMYIKGEDNQIHFVGNVHNMIFEYRNPLKESILKVLQEFKSLYCKFTGYNKQVNSSIGFVISFKSIISKKKNLKFSLNAKDVLKNKKIKKAELSFKSSQCSQIHSRSSEKAE